MRVNLKEVNGQNAQKIAAQNIRTELKAAFPGVKFSVVMSGYHAIYIHYTDGPRADEVELVVNRYHLGSFNGMSDSYEWNHSEFTDKYGGAQYIFVNRGFSEPVIEQAIAIVTEKWGPDFNLTVDGFSTGSYFCIHPDNSNLDYQQLIREELSEMKF